MENHFLKRISATRLPPHLEWHQFESINSHSIESIYQFLNKNYRHHMEKTGISVSRDYIRRNLTYDDGIGEEYLKISKDLSLAIKDRESNELVAMVIGRPTPIQSFNSKKIVLVVSLLCVDECYRTTSISYKLIKKYFENLSVYDLAQGAIFTGTNLPFNKLYLSNDYVMLLNKDNINKLKGMGGHKVLPFNNEHVKVFKKIFKKTNINFQIHQIFMSDEYFFNFFKLYGDTYTYCMMDGSEVVAWFSFTASYYTQQHSEKNECLASQGESVKKVKVANLSVAASFKSDINLVVKCALKKAYDLGFSVFVVPHNIASLLDDLKDLNLQLGSDQWTYTVGDKKQYPVKTANIIFY